MAFFQKKLTVNEGINAAHTSDNAVLIDCRSKEEFRQGHVPGAVSVPSKTLQMDNFKRRFPDTETYFYVIGSYDIRPQTLIKELKKNGYKHAVFSGYMEEHHGLLRKGN